MASRAMWAVVGLVFGLPVVAALCLHTPPGRRTLRWAAETGATAVIDGTVRIGALEGSPFGTLRLRDVQVLDRRGDAAAAADLLEVRHRIAALWAGELHVQAAKVHARHLDLPRLLSTLPAANDADEGAAGRAFVRIDHARLYVEKIVVDPATTVHDLELVAKAQVDGPHVQAEVVRLQGRVFGRAFDVNGAGQWAGDRIGHLDVRAQFGQARLRLVGVPTATGAVPLDGHLRWPKGAFDGLVHVPALTDAGRVGFSVRGDLPRLKIAMQGQVGGARVHGWAVGPVAPWQLTVTAANVDPHRWHARAPPGRVHVTITATAALTAEARPQGILRLRARGAVRPRRGGPPVTVKRLHLTARAEGPAIDGRLAMDAGRGRLRAQARLLPYGPTPRIHQGRLRLRRFALHRIEGLLPPRSGPLEGRIDADVAVQGPLSAPRAVGALDVHDLALFNHRLQRLQAKLRWAGPLRRPTASVDARATGVRSLSLTHLHVKAALTRGRRGHLTVTATGTGPVRTLHLAARGTRTATSVGVRWSRLTWSGPSATWDVRPGGLAYRRGRLHVPDLEARSGPSAIRVAFDVDPRRPLGARTRVDLQLQAVDLRALDGLVPHTAPHGRLDAQLVFDGARPQIRMQAKLHEGRWFPEWPVASASLDALVTAAEARVAVDVQGPRWGRVRARGRTHAPSPWRSPEAWRQPDIALLRSAALDWDVDLAALPALGHAIEIERGRTVGEARLGAAAKTMRARTTVSVAARNLPRISKITVTASASADAVEWRARARIAEHRASLFTGRLEHGLAELVGQPSLAALRGHFSAHVDGFPLRLLNLRTSPPRPPITGRVTMRARGGQGADGPLLVAAVRAHDVRLDRRAPPIAFDAQGHLDRHVVTATASLAATELGRHRLVVRSRTPARGDGRLTDHLQSLVVRSQGVTFSALRALGVGPPFGHGRLDLTVRAADGLRQASAHITARDVQVSPAVTPLRIEARIDSDPRGLRLDLRSVLAGAAFIRARGSSPRRLKDLLRAPLSTLPIDAQVQARGFPLARALVDAADRRDVDGRLVLTASVSGALGALDARARLAVERLRLGATHFHRFEVRHDARGPQHRTVGTFRQADGGRLAIISDGQPRWRTEVRAHDFGLGFASAVANLSDAGAAIDGTLDGELTVSGQGEALVPAGGLTIGDLRLAVPGFPALTDGRIDVDADQHIVRMALNARSGIGKVQATLRSAGGSVAEAKARGTFALQEVPVTAGGQVFGVDLNGRVTADRVDGRLVADVVLDDGTVRLPRITPRPLHPLPVQPDVVFREGRWPTLFADADAPTPPSLYAVHIRTADPIEIRGDPIQAMFGVDLTADGRPAGLSMTGDVNISQGEVTLFGRQYTVDRANVVLNGRNPPDPRLDIRLSHRFDACTFHVGLIGSGRQPKLVLSAHPDIYDDKQLLAFLFGASPEGDRYDKTPARQGLDVAAWVLLDQVRSRLKPALPFDTLAVDLGEGTDSGQANVTLGKWLTDRLFVGYAYHHGVHREDNTSEGLLRYRFLRSWLLEMVFGDRGNGGADVLWTKRW